jgi:hypothetical protein
MNSNRVLRHEHVWRLLAVLVLCSCQARPASPVSGARSAQISVPSNREPADSPSPSVEGAPDPTAVGPRAPRPEDLQDITERHRVIASQASIIAGTLEGFHSCPDAARGRDVHVRNRESPFDTPPYVSGERWDAMCQRMLECFACVHGASKAACEDVEAEIGRILAEVRSAAPPPQP